MVNIISALIPLAILLPNIFFIIFKSDNNTIQEDFRIHTFLNMLEGIGRISVFVIPIFYSIKINVFVDKIALLGLFVMLIFYYICWIRYFYNEKKHIYLYKPLFRIPVPMAISPVLYFIFASVLLDTIILLIGAVIFGFGHIPLSIKEYNYLQKDKG